MKKYVRNPRVIVLRNLPSGSDIDLFRLQFSSAFDQSLCDSISNGDSLFICFPCHKLIKDLKSLEFHCQTKEHEAHEEKFIDDMYADEMKSKLCTSAKSDIRSFSQAVNSTNVLCVGAQYLLEFNPGELDETPIYICTLPFCEFLGYPNELPRHFESEAHVQGYLHINGVDEYDAEMVQLLYNFDTEQIPETGFTKKIVDTYAYTQAARGLYPYEVCQFISSKLLHDMTENLTPKDYESFSKSGFRNMTNYSLKSSNAYSDSGVKISTMVEEAENEEDFTTFGFDASSINSTFTLTFVKEVKAIILDELESGSFESFDVDAKADEFAEDEIREHKRKGKRAHLCINPNIAKRICDKLKDFKLPAIPRESENIGSDLNEPLKDIKKVILDEIQSKGYNQPLDIDTLAEEFAKEEMLMQSPNCTINHERICKRISQRLALKVRLMKK